MKDCTNLVRQAGGLQAFRVFVHLIRWGQVHGVEVVSRRLSWSRSRLELIMFMTGNIIPNAARIRQILTIYLLLACSVVLVQLLL